MFFEEIDKSPNTSVEVTCNFAHFSIPQEQFLMLTVMWTWPHQVWPLILQALFLVLLGRGSANRSKWQLSYWDRDYDECFISMTCPGWNGSGCWRNSANNTVTRIQSSAGNCLGAWCSLHLGLLLQLLSRTCRAKELLLPKKEASAFLCCQIFSGYYLPGVCACVHLHVCKWFWYFLAM